MAKNRILKPEETSDSSICVNFSSGQMARLKLIQESMARINCELTISELIEWGVDEFIALTVIYGLRELSDSLKIRRN